jgi:hypothetical protein
MHGVERRQRQLSHHNRQVQQHQANHGVMGCPAFQQLAALALQAGQGRMAGADIGGRVPLVVEKRKLHLGSTVSSSPAGFEGPEAAYNELPLLMPVVRMGACLQLCILLAPPGGGVAGAAQ